MAVRFLLVMLIAVAGMAGWVFAFMTTQDRDALERRAIAAETTLSEVSKDAKTLAEVVESYKRGEKAAELQAIKKDIKDSRAELASVVADLDPAKKALLRLTSESDATRAELEKLSASIRQYKDLFTEAPQKFRTTVNARVRAGPGTGFQEVATVPEGIDLPVFETVQDGAWRKVGYVGYVHSELLEPLAQP